MNTVLMLVRTFLALVELRNGEFVMKATALEFARWTNLKSQLEALPQEQTLGLTNDGFWIHVPGVINLIRSLEISEYVEERAQQNNLMAAVHYYARNAKMVYELSEGGVVCETDLEMYNICKSNAEYYLKRAQELSVA